MTGYDLVERLERLGLENDVTVGDSENEDLFLGIFNTKQVRTSDNKLITVLETFPKSLLNRNTEKEDPSDYHTYEG